MQCKCRILLNVLLSDSRIVHKIMDWHAAICFNARELQYIFLLFKLPMILMYHPAAISLDLKHQKLRLLTLLEVDH